jgi:hypothetical protein
MGKPFDFGSGISRDLVNGHDEGNDKKKEPRMTLLFMND